MVGDLVKQLAGPYEPKGRTLDIPLQRLILNYFLLAVNIELQIFVIVGS